MPDERLREENQQSGSQISLLKNLSDMNAHIAKSIEATVLYQIIA